MMNYAYVRHDPLAVIGGPAPLPAEFHGLDDASLADLSWVGEPLAETYRGTGLWPVEVTVVAFDPETQRLQSGDPVPDPDRHVAVVTPEVVPLSQDELAARRAARAAVPMTPLEFARRLTLQERLAIRASQDPVVVDFLWLLDRASQVVLADPDTQAGINYMAAQGLLTSERAEAILTP